MLLKLSWYKSKLECDNFRVFNLISMVTTKKTAIEYTQKEVRKPFKHFTTKKLALPQKKTVMQEMRDRKAIRNIVNK